MLIAVVTGACLAAFIGLDDDDSSEQNATTNAASEVSETEAATQLDSDDDGIPDASDDEPYENPDDEEAPDETPEEQGPKQTFRPVGGSANDDDVRFKLESMQEVTTVPVGEYYEPIVPSRKAKLVSAVLTVKNNGQTKIDPFCGGASGVVLLDENDRNYEAEDNVIEIAGNDWVCGDGVSPGFKGTATLVFELPKKSDIGGLVVWNSEAENDYSGDTDQIVFTP